MSLLDGPHALLCVFDLRLQLAMSWQVATMTWTVRTLGQTQCMKTFLGPDLVCTHSEVSAQLPFVP
jgi:hypothetical protein